MTQPGRTVFRTPWFEIAEVSPTEEVSGSGEPYYCLVRSDGVICLILDTEGRVVMVDQYRPPLGRSTLEMPAGGIEGDESPDEAVAREVLEETGFRCEAFVRVATCRLMLNRENVVEHFYVGLRASEDAGYERQEDGRVRIVERDHLRELVADDCFEQTVALGALYAAERRFGIDMLMADIETIEARLTAEERA